MVKHDAPQIKSVNINKEGRFWAIKVDGKLLSIALYKRGAEAVQEMLQRLAGLPVTADLEQEAKVAKPVPKAEGKPAAKGGEKAKPVKAKPPQKKTDAAKPADAPTPAPTA